MLNDILLLEKELHKHKFRYYRLPDLVSISDAEYDLLEVKLKELYKKANRPPFSASVLNTVGYNQLRHIAFVRRCKRYGITA